MLDVVRRLLAPKNMGIRECTRLPAAEAVVSATSSSPAGSGGEGTAGRACPGGALGNCHDAGRAQPPLHPLLYLLIQVEGGGCSHGAHLCCPFPHQTEGTHAVCVGGLNRRFP